MKITKVVLSAERNMTAVYLEDGSRLERVTSIEAKTDTNGVCEVTIKALVYTATKETEKSKNSI